MSLTRARVVGAVISMCALIAGREAAAAGADGSWAPRCAAGTLGPDPAGRTLYVSTSGTDSTSPCPGAGHVFRTIKGAIACALDRDTIYVRGGTYAPDGIISRQFSARVLITNYPSEEPVIDGSTPPVGDYNGVLWFQNSANIAVQGLTIQSTGNTAPTTCPFSNGIYGVGGVGVRIDTSHDISLWNNTIQDTARHGLLVQGSQNLSVVGNIIQRTVRMNKDLVCNRIPAPNDSAVNIASSRGTLNSSNIDFINNRVVDGWGECVIIATTDGGRINGNRVFTCVGTNIYVDKSRNLTVARNYISWYDARYYKLVGGVQHRAEAISLANENFTNATTGYSVNNIEISSNIIENTDQGVHYFAWSFDGGTPDTYGNLKIVFNDINNTVGSAIKIDQPTDAPPTGTNSIRRNVVFVAPSVTWQQVLPSSYYSYWDVGPNEKYSDSNIGAIWTTPAGGSSDAYKVKAGSYVINQVSHATEPYIPVNDFFCATRRDHSASTSGAHEYGY
ncbi:MAG TPA: right-handed parallel beta-helix repeat-containing protein [Myxococcaceae bacterium]|nr:right-handed parallel beta-helix repeat-containing protein [Myxococcaceae bacterium]